MTETHLPPCWKSSDLGRVLALDAGQFIDELAPFMAVHLPLPGQEYDRGRMYLQPETGRPVKDVAAAAFATLTREDGDAQPLLVPVVGEPGSGKSHLVRWCYHRLQQQRLGGDTRFLAVYLPRQRASFNGMVEAVEEAIAEEGDEDSKALVTSLRSKVTRLTNMRPVEVARLVLADMTNRLDRISAEAGPDAVVAGPLFDIVREGGQVGELLSSEAFPVGRRASILLGALAAGEEHDPGWTHEDLAKLSSSAVGTPEFKAAIRKVARTDRPEDQEHACDLLNRVLDEAMAAQLQAESGGSTVTLSDAFRQLRRALKRSEAELVVLVEDVKTFQGLERSLLDAFIEPPDAETCRLRALIASTGGHWSRLLDDVGTLENRLGPTYGLALRHSGATESRELLMRLAGSHLNATRIGAKELAKIYGALDEEERNAWVPPSACEPCKYRVRCHGAFGTTSPQAGLDVGLFPFNEQALARTYAVAATKAEVDEDGVNPRVVVRNVLLPVLSEEASVKKGTFPPPPIRDGFSKPAELADMKAAIAGSDFSARDGDRAALTLELWGTDKNGSRTVSDEIAMAFGLGSVPSAASGAGSEEPEPKPDSKKPRDTALSAAITEWMNEGVMSQGDANQARTLVFQACMSRVPWAELAGESPTSSSGEPGIARELGITTQEHSIKIALEGVATSRPAGHTLVAEIARDDEGYRLLQNLARFTLRGDGERVDGNALIGVAEGIEPLVDRVISHARQAGFSREDDIRADGRTPRALLVTSLLMGCLMDPTAEEESALARALLMPDPAIEDDSPLKPVTKIAHEGVTRASGDTGGGRGRFSRDTAREWLLRRVVIRQSLAPTPGEVPRIVDAGRLIPLVRSLRATGTRLEPVAALETRSEPSDPGESALKLAQAVEGRALGSAIKSMRQRWTEVRKNSDDYGVKSDSPDEWFDALKACLAVVLSMVKGLREIQKEPDGAAYTAVKTQLLEKDSALRQALASDARERTVAVLRFGLGLQDVTAESIDGLAALGAFASSGHDLGQAIVDLRDNLSPAVDNARNLLESAIEQENPIVGQFDNEFDNVLKEVGDALQ